MSDNVKDNDPDADPSLMRHPRCMPTVASKPCDLAVVEGALGVLTAVAIGDRVSWATIVVNHAAVEPHFAQWPPRQATIALRAVPGIITKLYERGDGQPPRAIKVRRETDGREIFMVWTSVISKGARMFQWTSRGYQTRNGGMPTTFQLRANNLADPIEASALVLRWSFVVGDPFKDEGGANE